MRTLVLMLTTLLTSNVLAEEWRERLSEEGIVVESRLPPGKSYEEFRATVEVEATVIAAIALLKDNNACTRWLHSCAESHVIKQISDSERTFYQRTNLPFPAKDRDAVFHAIIRFGEDGSAVVDMVAQPDAAKKGKYVRLQDAYGTYTLTPAENERTLVTWQQYVDPAGSLPKWLVNGMLTDLPFRSLKNFREIVLEPNYQNATLVTDEQGNPVGISLE